MADCSLVPRGAHLVIYHFITTRDEVSKYFHLQRGPPPHLEDVHCTLNVQTPDTAVLCRRQSKRLIWKNGIP